MLEIFSGLDKFCTENNIDKNIVRQWFQDIVNASKAKKSLKSNELITHLNGIADSLTGRILSE